MKKIWQKDASEINDLVTRFTVGNDLMFDDRLAKYDVLGNIAQAKMLAKVGLITSEESAKMVEVLHEILASIENETFQIDPEAEDIHSQIEAL